MSTATGEKQSVALGSIVASALMTVMKLVVGLLTGSIGILSEAAHSGLDFAATVLTYLAVRVSDRPADEEHNYGHGKVESVAALAETALLFLTSIWIIYEAAHRLVTGALAVEATWYGLAVMLISIAIDAFRARALSRVAKATRSEALEADALHFSSDILSSGVVVAGLGLVYLGYPKGDAIAAIGVAGFVCLAGYRLGRRTIDTLIDTAPKGAAGRVAAIAERLPGVVRVEGVKVRSAGSVLFVDLDVAVSRTLPLDRVKEIQTAVAAAVGTEMPEAKPVVHAHPLALENETIVDRVQVIAANQGLAVHHITVQRIDERISVSLDLEVDGRQSIGRAHETASVLEAAIRDELGAAVEVETHIEPLLVDAVDGVEVAPDLLSRIDRTIQEIAAGKPSILDAHNLRVRQTGQGLFVSFHCHVAAGETVEDVHNTITHFEHRLRDRWPEIKRVIIHAEPATGPSATVPAVAE